MKKIILSLIILSVLFAPNKLAANAIENNVNHIQDTQIEYDTFKELIYDTQFQKYYILTDRWAIELEYDLNLDSKSLDKINNLYHNSIVKIEYAGYEQIINYSIFNKKVFTIFL